MPDAQVLAERPVQDQVAEYDAIVIGAGISGMFMLYRLRELGMTARVFESGTNVGGTWYWNRYSGARFDSESWTYGCSFSKELLQEWDWKERFSPQPDVAGRSVRRVLGYNGNGVHHRRKCEEVAAGGYQEFAFR
jgi:cation diffusion facilitator CzcD-associated flavoprotein CzcO